jgi:hypothetical protein
MSSGACASCVCVHPLGRLRPHPPGSRGWLFAPRTGSHACDLLRGVVFVLEVGACATVCRVVHWSVSVLGRRSVGVRIVVVKPQALRVVCVVTICRGVALQCSSIKQWVTGLCAVLLLARPGVCAATAARQGVLACQCPVLMPVSCAYACVQCCCRCCVRAVVCTVACREVAVGCAMITEAAHCGLCNEHRGGARAAGSMDRVRVG